MCFNPTTSFYVEVAKKDIVTFKVLYHDFYYTHNKRPTTFSELSKNLVSPIMGFAYELNTVYESDEDCELKGNGQMIIDSIDNAFHSYQTFKSALTSSYSQDAIVKCIIPKGSLYMKNNTEIVSNRIIIADIVYSRFDLYNESKNDVIIFPMIAVPYDKKSEEVSKQLKKHNIIFDSNLFK